MDVLSAVGDPADRAMLGREFGDYRITQFIAAGGMGQVYRAERIDGSFEREVAIKISAGSGLNQELKDRFLREQGFLASLNHPNISQLYDAGVTEEGWPYLVMELIDGQAIDDFVATHNLPIDAVVDLFGKAVDAVAFAHKRLLVHRDIKPSNVMVTADGQPKLLDFGIAKPLAADGETVTRHNPMTPRWASPEQLLEQPITVGSDVYQLGLLLARLLLGEPVVEERSISDAIQRAAAEKEIRIDPALRRRVPHELMLIVEQCLRFHPADRYASVDALLDDLKAYRQGYPVQAAGPSGFYRFRKVLARNRAATLTAAAALATIITGATLYTLQLTQSRDEAQQAAERAEEITGFLVSLFEKANPERGGRRDLLARDLVDEALPRLDELGSQPVTRAELTQTISHVYRELGRLDKAEELLKSSYATQLEFLDDDDPAVIDSLLALGLMSYDRGNYADALETYGEARTRLARSRSDTDAAMIRPLHLIANAQARLGNIETAREVMTQSLDLKRRYEGPYSSSIAKSLATLGVLAMWQGDATASEQFSRESIEQFEASGETQTPAYAGTLDNLGRLLVDQDRTEEGMALHQKAAAIYESLFGADHDEVAGSLNRIGAVYLQLGDNPKAIEYYRKSIATFERANNPPDHNIMSPLLNLASVYADNNEHQKAIESAERGIGHMSRAYGESHWRVGFALTDIGRFYAHVGETERGKATIERGLEIMRGSEVAGTVQEAWGLNHLADYYQTIGANGEALAATRSALDLAQASAPESTLVETLNTRLATLTAGDVKPGR
ncbi:MAG: serine/threonine-protein kinase [Pseudomonadota bacterium]